MLYLLHEAPPEEQNFSMVMEMISAAEVHEDDDNYQSPLDILFERLEMREPDSIACKQYRIFKQAAGKTAKSILVSVGVRLAAFNLPSIAKLTMTDELHLQELGERKIALFCCIPDSDKSLNYLVGMIYTQLIQTLYRQADRVHKGRLPVPVHCLMDEYANISLPKDTFLSALATMRSRAIFCSIIVQNMAQLKAMYKDDWESLVGLCDEFLYLGGTEKETHKYVSELLGKETISTTSYNQSKGRSGSYSINHQQSGRDLTTPDTVAAEPKHYVGYGNPVGGLNCAPCTMGRHDVFSDCLPVFEAAFADGKACDAMCSYNSIDSIPVSMDHELLTDVLRGQFGMPGFVRSDLTAVSRLYDWHFIAETPEEAIRLGLEAGVDLQLYDFPHDVWQKAIAHLIESGSMKMSVLDTACRRVLRMKFALGLFENPYTDEKRADKILRCPEHLTTAEKIAEKSIVLLKNDGLLPIRKDLRSVAVIGPAADTVSYGDYTETRGRKGGVSVLDGIRAAVSPETEVLYERGCNFLGQALHPFDPSMLRDENGESGLTGHYYNGPVPQGEPVQVRTDRTVNFNWIFALPHPALDANCFSVVWTGSVVMPRTMDGCIGLSTQDSMRLYVDDKLLIDGWGKDKSADQALDFHFEAGRTYKIRIEFVNDRRGARVIFGYSAGRENFPAAVEAARKADVAILCMGDNEETSGENFDRTDLNLPGRQLELVQAVYATGTPVVLVLQSGRPVTANWENDHLPAILEAWFPGEQGGTAIAKTLFGDAAPGGRLPITFPRSVGQIPCHYSRRPGGGKRYVEMDWLPLYPFGYGLTYTTFAYRDMALSRSVIDPQDTVTVSVTVTNTGKYTGDAVPQLYVRDMFSSVVKPERQLAAFRRLTLAPGESRRVELTVGPKQLRTLGPDYVWRVEPGKFELQLGDNAENILLRADLTVE